MELIILGIAMGFNFFILKVKAEQGRWGDLTFDVLTLLSISYISAGSYHGMAAGMVGSAIISSLLYFYPPKISIFGSKKGY